MEEKKIMQKAEKKKRPYVKPSIRFESFEFETPYATNCMADEDDMNDLLELGYFTDVMNCVFVEGLYENVKAARIVKKPDNDTICYHSNVIAAFMS